MIKLERKIDPGPKAAPDLGFSFTNCGHMDAHARVAIKQQAADNALLYTEKICKALKGEDSGATNGYVISKEMQQWITEAEEQRHDNEEFGISIGVRGATGAGKSSLLNALLELPFFLPVSCTEASTATASQISWNFENDRQKAFRAVIKFRDYDDLAKELDQLIADVKERGELGDNWDEPEDDDDIRAVLDEKIEDAIQKLGTNWDLEQQTIIDQKLTAANIIESNKEASNLLGTTLELSAPEAELFSEMIRPYLDSTPTPEAVTVWPLVQEVNLYVKSEILKHGVRLVDLPGASDSVAARSKVAEKYSANLDLTLIVLPAPRAIDEKTGLTLMSEYQELTARMGGNLTGPSFCAVVSQIDNLDSDVYIRGSADARNDNVLGGVLKDMDSLKDECDSNAAQLKKEKEKKEKIDEDLKAAQTKLNDTREELRELDNNLNSKKKKKKSSEDLELKRAELEGGRYQILKEIRRLYRDVEMLDTLIKALEDRQKQIPMELEMLEKKKQHRSVFIRNRYQSSKLKEGFRSRQQRISKGHPQSQSNGGGLDVFPISARAYLALLKDHSRPLGSFTSEIHTGIPGLCQWIQDSTIAKRERHLDMLLASYKFLYHDIDQWCDKQSEGKVDFSRSQIENILESTYNALEQKLLDTVNQLLEDLKKLIPWRDAEDIAASNQLDTIGGQVAARWAKKYPSLLNDSRRMASGTYAAILKRSGGPYTSRTKPPEDYDWPLTLSSQFLGLVLPQWLKAFNDDMPKSMGPHFFEINEIWNQLLDEVEGHFRNTAPGILPSFHENRSALEEREGQLHERLERLFAIKCRNSGADHVYFTQSIRSSLGPIFQTALGIRGKKSMLNRQAMIVARVKAHSPRMFIAAYQSMITAHEAHVSRFEKEVRAHPARMIMIIRRKLNIMLGKLESNAGKDTRIVDAKATMQEAVKALAIQWVSRWRNSAMIPQNTTTQKLEIPERYTEICVDPKMEGVTIKVEKDDDGGQVPTQGRKRKLGSTPSKS
ncbi:hypothetical protein QBC37DRAFT_382288 [Rhypophila decipiens]|uniref:Dynamin N-terminal domain-containing protein n=1 Tax=Rhypophila decipiens TaxID=261697 RepID=A0AAN6YJ41_9PEZI|nr:hypothetical protein QBC37DRAFT_382288 [Rhypophila decipiens]